MDLVASTKALNKTVEASQLTADLGGSFSYSHADWLQFHQVVVGSVRLCGVFPSLIQTESPSSSPTSHPEPDISHGLCCPECLVCLRKREDEFIGESPL